MLPAEVIVYSLSSQDRFDAVVKEAVDYALLSFPFTVNRMGLSGASQRIANIAKGKIAEGLLQSYSEECGLGLDFKAGATPFWMRDAFDFRWKGLDWDLKNNFLHHPEHVLNKEHYLELPALVPNRFEGDQWTSGDQAEKSFLFSFLRQSGAKGGKPFFDLSFKAGALRFLMQLSEVHSGNFPDRAPYQESWFWEGLSRAGGRPNISISSVPALIITGYCGREERRLFVNSDGRTQHGYAHYLGGWYTVRTDGGLSFCSGMLQTRITNATCPVGFLPAFKSLI